jgi:hypothetical protein
MDSSPQKPGKGRSHKPSFLLALLCLIGTACGTTSPPGKVLFADPRGTVLLRPILDRSFQASHPINLEPALLAQILKGVEIQDQEHGLQKMLAGPPSSVPLFSDDQVRFLAPLLAEGLRKAAPDQMVEYRIQATIRGPALESSITETTAGSLYAYGVSLYFSLSQYRYAPTRTDTRNFAHGQLPDSTGLIDRTLVFTPRAALRSESFHRPIGGTSTDQYLAIDYQLLEQGAPTATPSVPAAPLVERVAEPARDSGPGGKMSGAPSHAEALEARDKEIRTLKDLVIKKDLELESLRRELQSVHKQLDSQKRRTSPPSKPQLSIP